MHAKLKGSHDDEILFPQIDVGNFFQFEENTNCCRLDVSWTSIHGMLCDLDVAVMCFDERGRFLEKLTVVNPVSRDGSCSLTDVDSGSKQGIHIESVIVDFTKVDATVSCILLLLDGGPRNFQFIQGASVTCEPHKRAEDDDNFLSNEDSDKLKVPIYRMYGRTRKDYPCMVLSVLFKDGWSETGGVMWGSVSVFEPIYCSSVKEKEDRCTQLVVNVVPVLEKFKPRLFVNVRAICAALSSLALPKLKKNFFDENGGGLLILDFIEVIFKQLYDTHPKIIEESESGYLIAMLEEMFHQIDFNGDTTVDWDEFTTFCIQTGLVNTAAESSTDSLDAYVIEYGEELALRDRVLSPHRFISQMRHVSETKRILVIPEDCDSIYFFEENFRLKSQLYPFKIQVISGGGAMTKPTAEPNISSITSNASGNNSKLMIYDITYLSGRDLYAYCCSDHTLTICKEHFIGAKCSYIQHNKFYHALLHLRLCWSERSKVLCSVASDKQIYGWDIDAEKPIFQISRHNDLITDMIAIDNLELFGTCSLDKRIVLWSSTTKRVKAVLLGHKRGVHSLSSYENILLSAGFECEARLWDLVAKDNIGILRGHRRPIAAAKLMCDRAQIEEEQRAITVDEGGEFRLWNIYIKERSADPMLIPSLQIFEMCNSQKPINQIRFLATPNDPRLSTSYYSNLVACSTKLLHFLPEKNSKEFVPPTACIYNDAATCIVTAVGKSIMKYDICTGHFMNTLPDVSPFDLTALCLDGDRGRRMFIGCSNGDLILVNFTNGLVIDKIQVHTREITTVSAFSGQRNNIYTGSLDGRLRMLEEDSGKIHIHNTIDNAFGDGIGIEYVQVVESLGIVVAVSNGTRWGLWNWQTFKKIVVFEEDCVITSGIVIGVSSDEPAVPIDPHIMTCMKQKKKEKLITVGLAVPYGVLIYTVNVMDSSGIASFCLRPKHEMYITHLRVMNINQTASMNYTVTRGHSALNLGTLLIGTSDFGQIVSWEIRDLKLRSETMHKKQQEIMKKKKEVPRDLSPTKGSRRPSGVGLFMDSLQAANSPSPFQRSSSNLSVVSEVVTPNVIDPASSTDSFDSFFGHSEDEEADYVPTLDMSDFVVPSNLGTEGVMMKKLRRSCHTSASSSQFITEVPGQRAVDTPPHPHTSNPTSPGHSTIPLSPSAYGSRRGSRSSLPPLPPRTPKTQAAAPPPVEERNNRYSNSASTLGIPPDSHIQSSTHVWRGHLDTIVTFVEMEEHGCIITVSLDGYHRVWNLDGVCLGEMPLPNITDAMKNPPFRIVKKTSWKFILERIPVTAQHISLANQFVADILKEGVLKGGGLRSSMSQLSKSMNQHGTMGSSTTLDFISADGEEVLNSTSSLANSMLTTAEIAHNDFRQEILQSLVEAASLPADAPPSQIPVREKPKAIPMSPIRSPIQQGDLASMTDSLTEASTSGSKAPTKASPLKGYPSAESKGKLEPISPSPTERLDDIGDNRSMKSGISTLTPHSLVPLEHGYSDKRRRVSTVSSLSQVTTQSEDLSLTDSTTKPLWGLPSELKSGSDFSIPAAFSEHSLFVAHQHGMIDGEGYRLLRQISRQTDKIGVYDRSQSVILLRNPSLSTVVEVPDVNKVLKSEVCFGDQKDMYKNANSVMKKATRKKSSRKEEVEKHIVPKFLFGKTPDLNPDLGLKSSNHRVDQNVQHLISVARIDQNVRKVHSMVHVITPHTHDDVVLPKNAVKDLDDHSEAIAGFERRQKRLDASAAKVPGGAFRKPLNMKSVSDLVEKVNNALEIGHNYDEALREQANKTANKLTTAASKNAAKHNKVKVKDKLSVVAREFIEKKLHNVIKAKYELDAPSAVLLPPKNEPGSLRIPAPASPTRGSKEKKDVLNSRALLPYYKMADVRSFLDVFNKSDENFTGDLDINEWVKLFASLSNSITAHEAKMLFMQVDTKGEGILTFKDIVPIVFSKADAHQLKLICDYFKGAVAKNNKKIASNLTLAEAEQLFDCYEVGNIGFVAVSHIRESVRAMNMGEAAQFMFMERIADMEEDEMVNAEEFIRIFKPFISGRTEK